MQAGELVYTGATRTFLMAVAQRVPFRGAWTPVMDEYFASMADVHRILGALPEDADLHATADGRAKTAAASVRAARAHDRARRRRGGGVGVAATSRSSSPRRSSARCRMLPCRFFPRRGLPDDAPVVGARAPGASSLRSWRRGSGGAARSGRALVPADAELAAAVSDCAPAVAVALLLAADQ